jgi:hypothetical protein
MKENSESFIYATCCTERAWTCACAELSDGLEIAQSGRGSSVNDASTGLRVCVGWRKQNHLKPSKGVQNATWRSASIL